MNFAAKNLFASTGIFQPSQGLAAPEERLEQQNDAEQDQEHGPIDAQQIRSAEKRGKDQEHHRADKDQPDAAADCLANSSAEQTGKENADANKAGDERPRVRPTFPIAGEILVLEQSADSGDDARRHEQGRSPRRQAGERNRHANADDNEGPRPVVDGEHC